jgi:predicted TPR repeat methyltransferase
MTGKGSGANTRSAIDKAIALHRAGHLDKAKRLYASVLKADPTNVAALHFLGVLHHQRGQSERGVASIEQAIRLAPEYADAHNNLGNVLKEMGRLEPAFRAYRRVVELMPTHADAWNNLGVVLRGQSMYDEADQAYRQAIAANPAHVAAWQNRGNLLARLRRFDEAIFAYSRVLALRPRHTAAYDALGRTLYRAGKVTEALEVYAEWLRVDPGNSVATHMLMACRGGEAPARASDNYVRDTFDAFAGSFDQVLDQLGYRAPTLIAELLPRILPAPGGKLVIVDAGCGTGLCAPFLRPRAKRLVGVDLSSGMLARARARKSYDELVEAELTEWLARQRPMHDLIVSADTLCYFGALERVLSGSAAALRPGGWLVFTVERADDGVTAYQLTSSGRYSHAEPYVRDALAGAAFTAVDIVPAVLRQEVGHDVHGLLVSAQRSV